MFSSYKLSEKITVEVFQRHHLSSLKMSIEKRTEKILSPFIFTSFIFYLMLL